MAEPAAFEFVEPGVLEDAELTLKLRKTVPSDPAKGLVPAYWFQMLSGGREAGNIRLRIGTINAVRFYAGNVGYDVNPEFRGRRLAARSVRLLMPLARRHGLSELWITCNPDNIASRRTCELAGAEFVDIVAVPEGVDMFQRGESHKCRYRLKLGKSDGGH